MNLCKRKNKKILSLISKCIISMHLNVYHSLRMHIIKKIVSFINIFWRKHRKNYLFADYGCFDGSTVDYK